MLYFFDSGFEGGSMSCFTDKIVKGGGRRAKEEENKSEEVD